MTFLRPCGFAEIPQKKNEIGVRNRCIGYNAFYFSFYNTFKYVYMRIFECMNDALFELHAELCKTLADPKRLKVLYLLGDSEKSVSGLAKQMNLRQANLSQHLAVLRQRGVVESRKDGTTVFYRIAFPKMVKACNIIRSVLLEQVEQKQKIVKRQVK